MSKTINNLNKSLAQNITPSAIGAATNSDLNTVKNNIGTVSNLKTTDKTIVGAINELFQSANNGKQLIADAIGNPLITSDSTFSAMSEAILELKKDTDNEIDAREVLYNMMVEDGYSEANNNMTIDELIALLDRSGIETGEIKQITCGYSHTYILKNDGSLWACGSNTYGQLGLGDNTNRTTFTQVTHNINNDVKQVYCGYNNTYIIKNDGSLWACGYNGNGQLGLGNGTNQKTFIKVTTNINNDVKQVACGYNHTFILKNDGSLYSCGYNYDGELGLGNTNNKTTFTKVTININNDVKQIVCGYNHTFILKNDGSVWACGWNSAGQLGLNDIYDRDAFIKVTTNVNNVKQIACGSRYTFILKNDGSIWCCGYNEFGQLGLNDTELNKFTKVTTNINNDVKQIACGYNHTFIIKNDGSLWSCGYNGFGQLGLNDTNDRNTFTQVTTNINNDVDQICCDGYHHAFILKNDGSLWACGYNNAGQLGLNDKTNRTTFTNTNFATPIPESDIDKIALYNYLLSNDIEATEDMDIDAMLDLLVDYYITEAPWKKIENARSTLARLMQEGGYDITGEEDIDNLLDLLILSGISIIDIKQISCGFYHTMILKTDGSLWACGYNEAGQLGLGNNGQKNIFTQVTTNINNDVKQVICGDNHTFILKNDGSAWACGLNSYGQLGISDGVNRNIFTQVNNDVKQITCGGYHTVILKNDGSLWGCGHNEQGQLGLNDTYNRYTFTQITTNITNNINQITCNEFHTVILKTDGSVWCCGLNSNGELGLNDTNNRTIFTKVTNNINNDVKQVVCGGRRTAILKNDDSLWVCGWNGNGQLGLNDTNNRTTFTKVTNNINNDVKQVACGYQHTIILKNDGSIWTCGLNSYGQLGLNDTTQRNTFTKVTTNINNDIKQIACSGQHTFILKNDSDVYSCGLNNFGQLGLSNTTNQKTFTTIPRGF